MAELRVKPDTLEETVSQLWYAILGTNGEGLLGRLTRFEDEFERYVDTREQTCPIAKGDTLIRNAVEKAAGLKRERIRTVIALSGWVTAIIAVLKVMAII